MKQFTDILLCVVVMLLAAATIGYGFGKWADSLPPSPEERAGKIAGPR